MDSCLGDQVEVGEWKRERLGLPFFLSWLLSRSCCSLSPSSLEPAVSPDAVRPLDLGSETGLLACSLMGDPQSIGTTLVSSLAGLASLVPFAVLSATEGWSSDANALTSASSEAFGSETAEGSSDSPAEGDAGCGEASRDSAVTAFEDALVLASSAQIFMSSSSSSSSCCCCSAWSSQCGDIKVSSRALSE